jgi:hypothetical protein
VKLMVLEWELGLELGCDLEFQLEGLVGGWEWAEVVKFVPRVGNKF